MTCPNLLNKCFQTTGLKHLAETLVGEDKVNDFALWAFGKGYYDWVGMEKFANAWNERHSDLFKIDMSSPIVYDMIKMTELWRSYDSDV